MINLFRTIRWCTGAMRTKTMTMTRKTTIINNLQTRMSLQITLREVTTWSTTRVSTTTTMRARSTLIPRLARTSSTKTCVRGCSASSKSERPTRCNRSIKRQLPRSNWVLCRKRRMTSSRVWACNRPLTTSTISHRPLRNANNSLCCLKTMHLSARDRASLTSRWQVPCNSR